MDRGELSLSRLGKPAQSTVIRQFTASRPSPDFSLRLRDKIWKWSGDEASYAGYLLVVVWVVVLELQGVFPEIVMKMSYSCNKSSMSQFLVTLSLFIEPLLQSLSYTNYQLQTSRVNNNKTK